MALAREWWASQVELVVKNLPANEGRHKRHGFDSWVGKILWRRAQRPTPVFLSGESHGERSLGSIGSHRVGHNWSDLAFMEWWAECIFPGQGRRRGASDCLCPVHLVTSSQLLPWSDLRMFSEIEPTPCPTIANYWYHSQSPTYQWTPFPEYS